MSGAKAYSELYETAGGIQISRNIEHIAVPGAMDQIMSDLDIYRGAIFSSSYEYPGRYTRWAFGFTKPPLTLTACGREFQLQALNERGKVLLSLILPTLSTVSAINSLQVSESVISGTVTTAAHVFAEEDRSKQPSIFSIIRALKELFYSDQDEHLGFYGSFGYDLVFQFEDIPLVQVRDSRHQDLVLYLPDDLIVVDHQFEQARRIRYEFAGDNLTTKGLVRDGTPTSTKGQRPAVSGSDHRPGQYSDQVRQAIKSFSRGDLFEVVPSQTLYEPCEELPSVLFERLKERNPSPYGFLINLGNEHLIGASPEMYVRVEGKRVETCPISGTAPRGSNPLEDAELIRELLNSIKEESELTMCTDVDRNDKSRICEPGSVKVIGRRQIEMYSRVIHTVDHVEGYMREGYDALDAFLTHMWAVTVTGAPKRAAISFIEKNELSPRRWYGGAVGFLGFDGNLNTGLTLRTIRLEDGVAEVRVGATLLFDSDPEAEERETRHKAAALLDVIHCGTRPAKAAKTVPHRKSANVQVLLVDHQDSFVHTLANYLRQTGATVTTRRAGFDLSALKEIKPDLVVLSPGPGIPSDFGINKVIEACVSLNIPVFGVCLGLQGIVEYFGGKLGLLDYPMHGKSSQIKVLPIDRGTFKNLPESFRVARYHSLYAIEDEVPESLHITAVAEDGVVMAISHDSLPICAVQFHPESILTSDGDHGLTIIENVVEMLTQQAFSVLSE